MDQAGMKCSTRLVYLIKSLCNETSMSISYFSLKSAGFLAILQHTSNEKNEVGK